MGIAILANEKVILKCSNWILDVLYINLLNLIEAQDLRNDQILMKFIQKLDQDYYGSGMVFEDIAEHFERYPEELSKLISFVTQAIENAEHNEELDASASKLLWEFRDNLISYFNEIKTV